LFDYPVVMTLKEGKNGSSRRQIRGPVGYETRDLSVTFTGARTDGTATDVWVLKP